MNSLRILSRSDVQHCISMHRALDLMKDAFSQLSSGEAVVPLRINMEIPYQNARMLYMPVHLPKSGSSGVKVVSIFNDNAAKGLPLIQGLMLVTDAQNGKPLAVMDAEYLTALRTGAASGLATDILARIDAKILAIFGTGAQARTQVEGVMAVRDIEKVLVYGADEEQAQSFCSEMSQKHDRVFQLQSDHRNLNLADIICTATTSGEPVFSHRDLKQGIHINGVGSYKPNAREIPEETIVMCKLIVDQRETALKEAGDIAIPIKEGKMYTQHIYAELGEIVSGSKPGRTSDSEITVFKSVGNAAQDLAVAAHVIAEAEKKGLGTMVNL